MYVNAHSAGKATQVRCAHKVVRLWWYVDKPETSLSPSRIAIHLCVWVCVWWIKLADFVGNVGDGIQSIEHQSTQLDIPHRLLLNNDLFQLEYTQVLLRISCAFFNTSMHLIMHQSLSIRYLPQKFASLVAQPAAIPLLFRSAHALCYIK